MIYFLQAEGGGPIKIGYSENVKKRRKTLQTASPKILRVLATTPGGEESERLLHERFRHLHIRGDWFRTSQDLREFIAGLPKNKEHSLKFSEAHVEICARWLRECAVPVARVVDFRTSYYLKHVVEWWCKKYVSNDAFIEAARRAGYRIEMSGPNAYLNLKVVKPTEEELRGIFIG